MFNFVSQRSIRSHNKLQNYLQLEGYMFFNHLCNNFKAEFITHISIYSYLKNRVILKNYTNLVKQLTFLVNFFP